MIFPLAVGFTTSAPHSFARQRALVSSASSSSSTTTKSRPYLSSRDDEIEKLEEQLRKLKEEQEVEDSIQTEDSSSLDSSSSTKDIIGVAGTKESVSGRGEDSFFTEGDLAAQGFLQQGDKDDGQGSGLVNTTLGTVALVVAAAVFLFFFSMAPVGQEELMKYSGGSGNPNAIDLGDLNRARSDL
jgi:hypothetical protein